MLDFSLEDGIGNLDVPAVIDFERCAQICITRFPRKEGINDGKLAGGLYGVAIRGAFFGESMFSRLRDASKIALVNLVMRLKERGFTLLDTQYLTSHLEKFGAREIPRNEYLIQLEESLTKSCSFIDEEL